MCNQLINEIIADELKTLKIFKKTDLKNIFLNLDEEITKEALKTAYIR